MSSTIQFRSRHSGARPVPACAWDPPLPLIQVDNLSKSFRVAERAAGPLGAIKGLARRRYRTVQALDSVSFQIEPGELVGYIGPNGAGKSTTVKLLSGIMTPDSGTCLSLGYVPWTARAEYVRHIGVVFGQRTQLWWDLPVVESFELLAEIYRVPQAAMRRTLDPLLCALDIEPLLDTPVRQLSLGQRMRCEVAASMVHSPRILFLDEPTIGLDAAAKLAVRDIIRSLNRTQGVTVILTTHDMDDVEALCPRVLLIAGGRILSDGPLGRLRDLVTRERWLILDLGCPSDQVCDPDAEIIRQEGARVWLRFDPEHVSPAELIARLAERHSVQDLIVQHPPIEEVVARIYRAQTS